MLNINKVIVFSSDFVDLIKKGVDRANDDPKWKGKGFGLKRKDVELNNLVFNDIMQGHIVVILKE